MLTDLDLNLVKGVMTEVCKVLFRTPYSRIREVIHRELAMIIFQIEDKEKMRCNIPVCLQE